MVHSLLKLLSPRKRVFWLRFLVLGAFIFLVGIWFKSDNDIGNHIDPLSPRSEASQNLDHKLPHLGHNPPHIEIPNHLDLNDIVIPPPAQNELKKFGFPSNDEMADRLEFERIFQSEEQNFVPGLGENGKGVRMTGSDLQFAENVMKKEAFNLVLSDRIAYNRSVPDTRDFLCKKITYDSDLPSATVIIIFTNEAWSALIRTVWSVLNRSPKAFTKEIILVDDFSDKEELGRKLDIYVRYHFPSNVRLLRLTHRHGLIKARLEGAKSSKGDVLIFLDSHCEANNVWMEPLLQRIKQNRRAVLVPIIEVIDDKTMEYYSGNGRYFQVGGFTWSGHFTWIDVSQKEKARRGSPVAPTRTPTMAGGLFAIDRNYFWEIGSYDEGMEVWGGENLEMSFRIWMCGGVLETIPCSHVGHIFRSFHPYTFPGNKDTHGLNTARMAEVWMDDYKRLFYLHRPELQTAEFGDVSDRKEFRASSKCKSFKWYLDNLLPDKFILDEDSIAYGRLRNKALHNADLCLDTLQRNEKERYVIGFYGCHNYAAASQFLSLSKDGELRREEMCASAVTNQESNVSPVVMSKCSTSNTQTWDLNKNGNLIHRSTGKCLDRGTLRAMEDAYVDFCNSSPSQQWWFDHYNVS